jgi:dTDP-4-amino-4,6-dideoxygalactose transaminase
MRNAIAAAGGPPIFEHPLRIVRPVFPDINEIFAPFQAALASGQVTNGGCWVLEFERRLSEYLGVPTLVFCNGQMALMTMLRAAGVEGGEVIVPSFTFAATPHAVRWCGAEPVFADIAANGSVCLDPDDVERQITPKTVAILGVDAYGIACDYTRLTEIGRRNGLRVVFDSAPSFGARVGGSLVGGFGDAQIFSFHATKAFTTMEGGCLCPVRLEPAGVRRACQGHLGADNDRIYLLCGHAAGGDLAGGDADAALCSGTAALLNRRYLARPG